MWRQLRQHTRTSNTPREPHARGSSHEFSPVAIVSNDNFGNFCCIRRLLTPSPLSLILQYMEQTSHTQRGYRGGKAGAGVPQKLINQMPPHTVYIEAFLGHGAILLHKRPAQLNIGLDLDPRAVQVVRTRVQHRQSEDTCSAYGCDDDAAATIEVGTARYQLLVADALAFLRAYPFRGDELVYCDPPYVRSTRRTRARAYRYEMDDHQHAALLALLMRLRCAVMVSGYRSALYDQMLGDWRTIEFQAMTRRGPATEVVWMNYPPPTDLHEYTHLGQTFRERERQKRQQARWVQKVAAKPLLEQKALLAGLLEGVGPLVSTEVVRSALAQFGDETLIASNGTSGSPHLPSDDAAASTAPAMPRASRCTICRHPERQRIDQALASGVSLRTLAQQEGVSKSVLGRHRDHRGDRAVSHLRTATSGTADKGHRQESTPRSVQLELLALEAEG